jgi:hypothetical protein
MNRDAKDNAVWAGVAAVLMLGYGWGMAGWIIPSDAGETYRLLVHVFDWMLKIGGIAMAVVTVVCALGWRVGLLLDVLVSGICGLIMAGCPLYWLLTRGLALTYLVYILFGVLFLGAARGCWQAYRLAGCPVGPAPPPAPPAAPPRKWLGIETLEPPKPPPKAEPPHPASIRPKSLGEGDQPPPEGYLAALAKEDEQPPTASYK